MQKKLLFPIYEFRPLELLIDMMRYDNGEWVEDDGEYDLAFIGRNPKRGYPEALYVRVPYRPNILWSWHGGNWGRHEPRHPNGNAWHYMLREGETKWGMSWKRDRHPNEIASKEGKNRCADKYGCANSSGPEFHVGDEYIKRGLLRELETKKIITFPKVFDCMYCGVLKEYAKMFKM